MKDLAGKTALVTGAASGIGLGVATSLAQAGVRVMLCDIEQRALDAAVAQLKETNADVAGVKADVSLKTELQAAADATLGRYGEVHILHNNAGVVGGGTYGAWTDASWSWTIAVNLMAVVWGVEIFAPLIERHGEGGHIVNTASMAGLLSGSSNAYNVTKYGVVALSEGLRVELAPRGIGVSVLCPGFIRTHIVDSDRNRPDRFVETALPPPTPGASTWLGNVRDRIAGGIDPLYVGDLVREAIEGDWPYVFTDNEFEPAVDARFANIKAGFDRIRGREPRR
ncbi:MAG TPA: SDR family NAD(P)-dependent oxidoreductase, partial [Caulobacteraceae bacterium]|jgi:NAD(P)-dependent dehydrogenase (short-subunit alcohol dehydrogenase family)